MYDVSTDELRCRTTDWLWAQYASVVREERRLHAAKLRLLTVLDERGHVDDSLAQSDGVSVRDVRDAVDTARALDALPEIAGAAARGELSNAQLSSLSKLADPDSDREWARKGPGCSPEDLRRQLRSKDKPTGADGQARRAARSLRFWWEQDTGMLAGRFCLPDIDGALFEAVINKMTDRMRPTKGQGWETRERRGADALVALCRDYSNMECDGPTPLLVVDVPMDGPATIVGIPLPDGMVEKLRASAKVESRLVDHDGQAVTTGRAQTTLAPKKARAVRLRDGKCRWPGCDRRTGLQIHHLTPRSWGGDDEIANLASVCTGGGTDHHAQLAPQGPYLLLGNPNDPHGLQLVHRDDLSGLARLAESNARSRAGPEAA